MASLGGPTGWTTEHDTLVRPNILGGGEPNQGEGFEDGLLSCGAAGRRPRTPRLRRWWTPDPSLTTWVSGDPNQDEAVASGPRPGSLGGDQAPQIGDL